MQAAHDLGIAVILDVVYNHFGWQDLALWQYDGWYQTGVDRDGQPKDFGGIYFYQDWRYWTGYGDRPDYGRPEVRDYIAGNVRMWLQDYRIDGLRLDATSLIRNVYGDDNQANDLPDGRGLLRRRMRLPLTIGRTPGNEMRRGVREGPSSSILAGVDLRQLEIFAKVAELGSFSRAAEALSDYRYWPVFTIFSTARCLSLTSPMRGLT